MLRAFDQNIVLDFVIVDETLIKKTQPLGVQNIILHFLPGLEAIVKLLAFYTFSDK